MLGRATVGMVGDAPVLSATGYLVAMVTPAAVAAFRARIDEHEAEALAFFEDERFSAYRRRIRSDADAWRASLLAAELTLPQEDWSDELVKAVVHPDPLLALAASEAGVELPHQP
jgi:hypothetical protein